MANEHSSVFLQIPYQNGNNESSQYTDNYTGTEDYDPVSRDINNDDDDEYGVAGYEDDEYDVYSDDDDDDDDDEEEDDEDEDDDDYDDYDDGDSLENQGRQSQTGNRQNGQNTNNTPTKQNKKQDLTNLHIDLQKFILMWPLVFKAKAKSKDPEIGPLYTKVRNQIMRRIESLPNEGPAAIKVVRSYYNFKEALALPHGGSYGAFELVFIDDWLEIITSMGKSLLLTTALTAKAFGDQTWTDAVTSLFLKRILETAIYSSEVYHDLNQLYRKVVAAFSEEDDTGNKKK